MNHEFWYLSRAAGFTAYLLLFVSVALGISMGTRLIERVVRRNTVFDLHRFTTLLALAFTLFHVYILLLDGFFNFNVWQLSIPFLSPYRGWQIAVGVFALYALVLIIVSFYARQAIGYRAWRALHFLTFGMFALAAFHGIVAGTDTTESWAKAIYVATGAATVLLILYRVQYRMPDSSGVRAARLASVAATLAVAALLMFGTSLLRAHRAPASVDAVALPAQGLPSAGPPPLPVDAHPFLASFSSDFSGTYQQTQEATSSHLVLDGATSGDLAADVHVELTQTIVAPTPDNEVNEHDPNDNETTEAQGVASVTVNTAQLTDPNTHAVICTGKLTSLNQGAMRLTCDGTGPYQGVRMDVSGRLGASPDGTFSGALSGTMQRLA
ncbi:MAG: ferric reductase-like transmembrane domain-containing protein [Chloroflexota bacterium]|nr:ferric reductase-like transmembrane domain-containing protein [Chloroflexota bacterium]